MALATKAQIKKETAAVLKYLENRKVLIADPSSSSRSSLFNIFRDIGVKPSQLILVNSFNLAASTISSEKPHVVLVEYDLGKRCGIELFQTLRSERPKETKELLFIVVTGNNSQSAVARSAEEDIDAFILKPFTPENVRKIILKTAIMKIKPPQYLETIENGKTALEAGKFDEAEKLFLEATNLDAAPSLAYYYLGQIRFIRKVTEEAKGKYAKGLEFNRIHYKCMVGLYELFMNMQQLANAYEVVKRISQYFPANPKRLAEVLRLAIANAKYEDIEKYYAIFTNIDDRDEMLIKYVCAALVVCGKHYLGTGLNKIRAMQLFQKAAATGTGRGNVIKEIVTTLVDYNLIKEAKGFVERYPADLQGTNDYQMLKFMLLNAEAPLSLIVSTGRDLLGKGVVDERLFRIMLQRSVEAGLNTAAETIAFQAAKHFPKKQQEFMGYLKKKAA
ncbi:MAG: response regulator [Deltaproteobacteria bacterium]|nr:response regulator [Deltaproteobacteria bacterium]